MSLLTETVSVSASALRDLQVEDDPFAEAVARLAVRKRAVARAEAVRCVRSQASRSLVLARPDAASVRALVARPAHASQQRLTHSRIGLFLICQLAAMVLERLAVATSESTENVYDALLSAISKV